MQKKYTNAELIFAFEQVCFRHTNYPNNNSIYEKFMRLEKELCKRMGVDPDEVYKLYEKSYEPYEKTRVDDGDDNHEEIHC